MSNMKYKSNAEVEKEMREDPTWKGYFKALDELAGKAQAIKIKQDALLKELGFKLTFDDVMALLQDEERLKVVVKKLKMKAFL